MILVACYGLTVMFTTLLICRPLAYNWDPTIKGKCGDTHKLYLSVGIVNLLLDVTVVSLPMPLLWRLQVRLVLPTPRQAADHFEDEPIEETHAHVHPWSRNIVCIVILDLES